MTLTERVTHTTPAASSGDRAWRFWPLLPIYPYANRRTTRCEIEPGRIWTFEQVQGIFYVVVPIRMTVVKLAAGGLLVYAPVAPTVECLELMRELVAVHGDIKYIILPTISGLEHKVYVPAFARAFPHAQVWIAPNQWSFPVNLPLSWLGFPRDRTFVLPADSSTTPFADEFDYAILETIDLGPGQFSEVAMWHRSSRILLVTDAIVSVPATPPDSVQKELYPLLFHARDRASDPAIDTPAHRIKGWQRICLFALYFQSSVLAVPKFNTAIKDALTAPDRSRHNYFGLYPFDWQPNWQDAFTALRRDGKLLVAPILRTLILNRAPIETLAWADRVATWNFDRIIPCHFDAPIVATAQEFRSAFAFLEQKEVEPKLPVADIKLLQQIERNLERFGIIIPAQKI